MYYDVTYCCIYLDSSVIVSDIHNIIAYTSDSDLNLLNEPLTTSLIAQPETVY